MAWSDKLQRRADAMRLRLSRKYQPDPGEPPEPRMPPIEWDDDLPGPFDYAVADHRRFLNGRRTQPAPKA